MLETNNNIIIVDDQERDLHYLSNVFCEPKIRNYHPIHD